MDISAVNDTRRRDSRCSAVSTAVSFILPAYNEAEMLETTVRDVLGIASQVTTAEFEVVIVQNGSSDNTADVADRLAEQPHVVALHLDVGDYGAAMHAGLVAASHPVAVVFDCDLYDAEFAADALSVLDGETVSVVVASKRHAASSDERGLFRRCGTWVFTSLIRALTGLKASDTHGMKVVDLRVAKELVGECQLRGHVFDTELVLRSEKAGLKVIELPCSVAELRPARSSYISRVPAALKQAWELRKSVAQSAE